jgi:hypothetical protein
MKSRHDHELSVESSKKLRFLAKLDESWANKNELWETMKPCLSGLPADRSPDMYLRRLREGRATAPSGCGLQCPAKKRSYRRKALLCKRATRIKRLKANLARKTARLKRL